VARVQLINTIFHDCSSKQAPLRKHYSMNVKHAASSPDFRIWLIEACAPAKPTSRTVPTSSNKIWLEREAVRNPSKVGAPLASREGQTQLRPNLFAGLDERSFAPCSREYTLSRLLRNPGWRKTPRRRGRRKPGREATCVCKEDVSESRGVTSLGGRPRRLSCLLSCYYELRISPSYLALLIGRVSLACTSCSAQLDDDSGEILLSA
jgi:hypothetical protein